MPTADTSTATLAWDAFGPADGEPLLLVQGLGVQMLGWRRGFCEALAARGFRVIRFDNRDIGLSSRHPARPLTLVRTLVRSRLGLAARAPYTLERMAEDAVGLLDHLGLSSAHLAGVSMGGMIAQLVAIRHPSRVRSLCSISSSPSPTAPTARSWRLQSELLRLATLNDPARSVDAQVRLLRLVGTRGCVDERDARAYFERCVERAPDRSGVPRQLGAILASPDRRGGLRSLRLPAAVIHGAEDPLIPASAGYATARAIDGARFHLVERLAHDLPKPFWPRLTKTIADNAARAADAPSRRAA
ncbi:MAG TPA: alpha/beta fold hydrolase [Sandaracinaceae bacterium LLY-WYZ-13_1]|nr:alpha/beta fold hydrolase [Sandaracinaceae bacterium LLY-WYZ-13_1]